MNYEPLIEAIEGPARFFLEGAEVCLFVNDADVTKPQFEEATGYKPVRISHATWRFERIDGKLYGAAEPVKIRIEEDQMIHGHFIRAATGSILNAEKMEPFDARIGDFITVLPRMLIEVVDA